MQEVIYLKTSIYYLGLMHCVWVANALALQLKNHWFDPQCLPLSLNIIFVCS